MRRQWVGCIQWRILHWIMRVRRIDFLIATEVAVLTYKKRSIIHDSGSIPPSSQPRCYSSCIPSLILINWMNRHDYLVQWVWPRGVERLILAFKWRVMAFYCKIGWYCWGMMKLFRVISYSQWQEYSTVLSWNWISGWDGYIYGRVDGVREDQTYEYWG